MRARREATVEYLAGQHYICSNHLNCLLADPPTVSYLLCMSEYMMLEILPSHEQFITVITLQIFLPSVYNHVRLQVGLLSK